MGATRDDEAGHVKRVTGLNTLILCLVLLWVYRGEIFSAVGTYAYDTPDTREAPEASGQPIRSSGW